MDLRTRSYTHSYDNRTWRSLDDGKTWVVASGSVEQHASSVTADYTKRDYRKLIAMGDNATSYMQGTSSGYRTEALSTDPREALKRPRLDPAMDGFAELEVFSWTMSAGKPTSVQRRWRRGPYWRLNLTVPSDTSLLSQVDNQALLGFNRKVLKAQRAMQGLVSLGELGETLRMIRNPAKTLRLGINDYFATLIKRGRRIKHRRPRIIRDIAAGTWLEYSFGWKPLISDIHDGAEALAKALYERPPRKFVSFTSYGRKTTIVGSESSNTDGEIRHTFGPEVRTHNVGIKYYGVVGMPQVTDGFDQSQFGVTWSEIIPTVWELIPYSFLVDYFSNIGDIISSYSSCFADVRWMTKGTCVANESSLRTMTLTPNVSPLRQYIVTRRAPGSRCFKVNRTISRDTYTGSRIPRLEFSIPGMGLKWVNIAALGLSRDRALFALRGR